jgi:hypothetical protein
LHPWYVVLLTSGEGDEPGDERMPAAREPDSAVPALLKKISFFIFRYVFFPQSMLVFTASI